MYLYVFNVSFAGQFLPARPRGDRRQLHLRSIMTIMLPRFRKIMKSLNQHLIGTNKNGQAGSFFVAGCQIFFQQNWRNTTLTALLQTRRVQPG